MSSTQKEITRYAKKQENVTRKEKKKSGKETTMENTSKVKTNLKDLPQKHHLSQILPGTLYGQVGAIPGQQGGGEGK